MLAAAARAWNRFWFTPVESSTLGVLRIAFGVVTFLWTVTLGFDLDAFFGNALLPNDSGVWSPGVWSIMRWWQGDAAVTTTWLVLLVASACLTIGFRTRLASVLVFVGLVSFQRRNPFVFNSGDVLFRLLALYLVLAPAGAALSVDRWRRARDRFWEFPSHASWVLRLVQLQLCFIYLSTVVAKSRGATWGDGTAVSYALRIADHARFDVPGFVTDWLPLVALLTYGTLALEVALGTLVWSRRLRPFILAAGVTMHVAIDLTLLVGFFSAIMLTAYIAWVPPDAMSRWLVRRRPAPAMADL